VSGNSGAWGVAMWRDGYSEIDGPAQEQGISLEGGDPVLPYLPTDPVGTLLVPPLGLGVPAIRSGDVAFAQRDGVVQFADYYEPRQITFSVLVKNDDCPGCSSSPQVDGALVLDGVSPGRAYTPDSPALEITGDLDIDVHVALTDWTPAANMAFVSQFIGNSERAYIFQAITTGQLRLIWNEDGTAATQRQAQSTVAPTVTNGAPLWVRVTLDVDNGAAGRTVTFYTSSDGVNWTMLGTPVVQAGVTSVFDSSADVEVGSHSGGTQDRLIGEVYSARIRSGIGGTIVANPTFDDQTGRYSSFADEQGNVWFVVLPAMLVPFEPARLSARQKVSRLTQEWSRNCSGASLVLFTDCHNPDASGEERVYNGPYLVHGRPRVADVVWERSNRGAARVTLRFDAADARLVLVDTIPGTFWTSEQVQTVEADEQNLAPDPDLSSLSMTLNGATVDDSFVISGGPNDGPFFRRIMLSPNTTSPMTMALSGTGTAAIPVDPGDVLSIAWWVRKDPGGGPAARVDWTWYNAGGAVISPHNGASQTATATWGRVMQENIVAPALAEFVQFRLVWSGTGLTDQFLELGQVWINEGATSTAPATVEILGTLCAYPVFRLRPNLTAPIVVTYGNHQFTYTEDIGLGDAVDVDTRWGRASDGFQDVTVNLDGDFISPLAPGVHEFTVQTGNPADTGFVTLSWENSVVSG
jgi:hypothetical protein